jgi:membrane protein implicated in regulation of membrane protease activity
MQLEWWHWTVFGIVLILAELAVPAFVLVWFGLGALLVAVVLGLTPDASLTTQIALWTAASLAMVVLWFRVFKPGFHKTRIGRSDAHVVGEVGLLVQDVEPFRKGRVRFQKPLLGDDLWDCIADEKIASGERVRVLGVEGSLLKIGKA